MDLSTFENTVRQEVCRRFVALNKPQSWLKEQLGWSHSDVSYLLHNRDRRFSLYRLEQVVRVLGITIEMKIVSGATKKRKKQSKR